MKLISKIAEHTVWHGLDEKQKTLWSKTLSSFYSIIYPQIVLITFLAAGTFIVLQRNLTSQYVRNLMYIWRAKRVQGPHNGEITKLPMFLNILFWNQKDVLIISHPICNWNYSKILTVYWQLVWLLFYFEINRK